MKLRCCLWAAAALWLAPTAQAEDPVDIGSRRELLVDGHLIDKLVGGASLQLHRPQRREVALKTDAPWEGNASHFRSVVPDGDRIRMYYGAFQYDVQEGKMSYPHEHFLCYAESGDGIRWTKPQLGLVSYDGSKHNNIVLSTASISAVAVDPSHAAVFKDANPACPADAKYKVVIRRRDGPGLYALKSADGLRFSLMSEKPLVTEGRFDSQNLAFWDPSRGQYRLYYRDFLDGRRAIRTATSDDFLHWTEGRPLTYPGAAPEQLYTNQIQPYLRAPHLLVGFPLRYTDRGWTESTSLLPGLQQRRLRSSVRPRYGSAVTDSLFMTSRDGETFHRWGEAWIRPGPARTNSWVYGDNSVAWGMTLSPSPLPQAPDELSFYATEGYWTGRSLNVRRYALRIDGFVSARAPLSGGEVLTRPLRFAGSRLTINYSTSAAGGLRVEIQDEDGRPLDNFSQQACDEIFGDQVDRSVTWGGSSDVGPLAGSAVRLRFILKDADLYSFRFQ